MITATEARKIMSERGLLKKEEEKYITRLDKLIKKAIEFGYTSCTLYFDEPIPTHIMDNIVREIIFNGYKVTREEKTLYRRGGALVVSWQKGE